MTSCITKLAIVLAALSSCALEPSPAPGDISQAIGGDLIQLSRFEGVWTCTGQTDGRAVTAVLTVTDDHVSILGETQDSSSLSISDRFIATSTAAGTQQFRDNRGGQEVGSYGLTFGIGGALRLDSVGPYMIFGTTSSFRETRDLSRDSSTFSLTSSLDEHVFRSLTCAHLDQE